MLHRGVGFYLAGMPEHAIEQFMRAVRIDAANAAARLWLATAYLDSGERDHAKLELNRLLKRKPDDVTRAKAKASRAETFSSSRSENGTMKSHRPALAIPPRIWQGWIVCWIALPLAVHAAPAKPAERLKTVAVLDFVNRNLTDDFGWLGKGLSDMVIHDLRLSGQFAVVDREQLQAILREQQLGQLGLIDKATAPRVGRIAKADLLLFGTYESAGGQVTLEAELLQIPEGKSLTVAQVSGPLTRISELEEELVSKVLSGMRSPLSENAKQNLRRLKTRLLPAFEHYSRGLAFYDAGKMFESLRRKPLGAADRPEIPARCCAQVSFTTSWQTPIMLPSPMAVRCNWTRPINCQTEYYKMARIFRMSEAGSGAAETILRRIVARRADRLPAFNMRTAPREKRQHLHLVAKINKSTLESARQAHAFMTALLRTATAPAGRKVAQEAAKAYSQAAQCLLANHPEKDVDGIRWNDFGSVVHSSYQPLYLRLINENRDAEFYPPETIYLVTRDQEIVAAEPVVLEGPQAGKQVKLTFNAKDFPATHGEGLGYRLGRFVATPDQEFSHLDVKIEPDGIVPREHVPDGHAV